MMALFIILASAYLAGSVNFSILLFALAGKGDPRTRFSGNAGTVNVWRQAGLGWAAMVLFLDMFRAAGLAMVALYFLPRAMVPWIGLALILGNRYPCFHGFRGGKGVAAYLGFAIPIAPWAVVLSAIVWTCIHGLTHLPFIASFGMVAVLAVGTIIAFGYNLPAVAGVTATALFIFYNHRENILNLIREKKWGSTG